MRKPQQINEQVGSQVRKGQVIDQVWRQVSFQVDGQVWDQVDWQVRSQVKGQVWDHVSGQVYEELE